MKKILFLFLLSPYLLFSQAGNISHTLKTRIDSLRGLLPKQSVDSAKAKIYLSLSVEMSAANLDSAIYFCKHSIGLAEKAGNKKSVVSGHNLLGNLYQRKSMFDEALKEYQLSLRWVRELNNKAGIAVVYGGIANCYTMSGALDSAVKYRILAVKMAEASGSKKIIASAHGNMGELYFTMKNYPLALENFRYHLKMEEESGNKARMIIPLSNIAYALMNMRKGDEALPLLLRARKLAEETGSTEGLSVVLNNLGTLYQEKGELTKASVYYTESLKLAEDIGDAQDMSLALFALGNIQLEEKNYDKALSYFQSAYQKARLDGTNVNMQNALWGLASTHEKKGNTAEALKYYKLYSDSKDSLLNKDISRQLTEMTTRYETEKKENKIKLLSKENELRQAEFSAFRNMIVISSILALILFAGVFFYARNRRINEKIKMEKQVVELEQQALRLQMNPHFIFNSLSSISHFIGRNEAAEAKKFLAKFAKLMRLILENSREEYVPLQKEIDSLQNYMDLEQLRANNKFHFELQVDEAIDPETQCIPPMLIQPHLENAVLHGIIPKSTNGKILLSFTKKKGGIECLVQDDGIGREKAGEKKTQTGETHKSLALTVTQERLNILHGNENESRVLVEDLLDTEGKAAGTKIKFMLPVKENI